MSKLCLTVLAASIGLLASCAMARAQFVDYTTSFSPGPIPTDQPGSIINVFNGSNSSGVFARSDGTEIVTTNFTTTTNVPNTPGALVNSNYNLTVTLTLANPGGSIPDPTKTHDFHFSGKLNGHIGTSQVDLFNTFISATDQFNFGTVSNPDTFTITLDTFVPPDVPGSTSNGSISAKIFGPVTTQQIGTPEPGSLALLFGMALPGTLLVYRRRRR